MDKKSLENGKNQHEELELDAAKRVVAWTQLRPNDYRFKWASKEKNKSEHSKSKAKPAEKEFLRAGCVYEYARESRKLRCLLVLINSAFQKAIQAEKTQSQPPFHGLQFLSLSFEGLRYKDALLWLGGWFGWLGTFTNELADNTSFAELCKENREQLDESLGTLPKYFYAPRAVELAFPKLNESLVEPRLLWPWQAPDVHHRNIENDVIITFRIRLRDFTNKQIGKAMEEWARILRPPAEKEPTRKGTGKRDSPRSWLSALSAMRLASYHPKTSPSELVRRRKKTSARKTKTALSIFEDVRLGSIQPGSTKRKIHGALSQNELDRYAALARRHFQDMFPFDESAANSASWAERQRGQIV
jgi:hypothetical protein